jgi:hypothetical protein
MNITMDDSRLTNITEVQAFLKGSLKLVVTLENSPVAEKYKFISATIFKFRYFKLGRKDKRVVLLYLKKITGYKHTQLFDLVERARISKLFKTKYKRIHPSKIYTGGDIKLLEKTDELHLRLSEMATQKILSREYEVFGHSEFQTISSVSHSHITNLRHSLVYKSGWINHTKARQIQIGKTMKPESFGKPGSIRVDAVNQRDIYHINAVDEVTQWEVVFCVPQITEDCMLVALKEIFSQFPFKIFNFHSDRGHENINYQIANFLQKLLIKQTKSRSYHSNDNALVETKNGSVIRKNMGWEHIDQILVNDINNYYKNFFNIYLNYHRPCGYPTISIDLKGRKTKVYKTYNVPYEILKQIPNADKFLKPEITFKKLDKIAYQMSDNDFAKIMRQQETKLFDKIETVNKSDVFFKMK